MEIDQSKTQRFGMRLIVIVYGIALLPATLAAIPGLMLSDSGGILAVSLAMAAFFLPVSLIVGIVGAVQQSKGQGTPRLNDIFIIIPLLQIAFLFGVLFF